MDRDPVRLPRRDKDLLLHRILLYIIIIDGDADLAFMYAPAHIPAHCKHGIPLPVHVEQPDPVI